MNHLGWVDCMYLFLKNLVAQLQRKDGIHVHNFGNFFGPTPTKKKQPFWERRNFMNILSLLHLRFITFLHYFTFFLKPYVVIESYFYHILPHSILLYFTVFYDFRNHLFRRFSQEGEITGQGRQELNGWSYVGGFLRGSGWIQRLKGPYLDVPGISDQWLVNGLFHLLINGI